MGLHNKSWYDRKKVDVDSLLKDLTFSPSGAVIFKEGRRPKGEELSFEEGNCHSCKIWGLFVWV